MPIRVGIVGGGTRGWAAFGHVPALRALPAFELVAVSTTRQASADEAARAFRARHAFASAEALASHPDVDLVVVSVKAPEHGPAVRAALAAGKDVLVEWPLAPSSDEAEELLRLADARGTRHFIGLQRRFWPAAQYAASLVREGYLGTLRSWTGSWSHPFQGARRPAANAYTADVASGAHALGVLAGHFLDVATSIAGPIAELSGVVARHFDRTTLIETGEVIPVSAPDNVVLAGRGAGGEVFTAHVEDGKGRGSGFLLQLTGTDGDLELRSPPGESDPSDPILLGARGTAGELAALDIPARFRSAPELHGPALAVAQLYAAVARGDAPGFAEAVRLHRLLDAVALSSDSGVRQKI